MRRLVVSAVVVLIAVVGFVHAQIPPGAGAATAASRLLDAASTPIFGAHSPTPVPPSTTPLPATATWLAPFHLDAPQPTARPTVTPAPTIPPNGPISCSGSYTVTVPALLHAAATTCPDLTFIDAIAAASVHISAFSAPSCAASCTRVVPAGGGPIHRHTFRWRHGALSGVAADGYLSPQVREFYAVGQTRQITVSFEVYQRNADTPGGARVWAATQTMFRSLRTPAP